MNFLHQFAWSHPSVVGLPQVTAESSAKRVWGIHRKVLTFRRWGLSIRHQRVLYFLLLNEAGLLRSSA